MTAPSQNTRPAVVLLSGGLDSATTAAIAQRQGFTLHALTFDYGQRHAAELDAARRVAKHLDAASHRWITIDLRAFGGSALTDDISVPKDRPAMVGAKPFMPQPDAVVANEAEIPVTYVPARNTIFLSYALALAEVIGCGDIFIGANAVDYSGYPDCRPGYLQAFEQMANLATKAAVEGREVTIHSPLIDLTKPEIIRKGLDLGVDYSLTHSCYDPDTTGRACGRCDACLLRTRAFEQLGMTDPATVPVGPSDITSSSTLGPMPTTHLPQCQRTPAPPYPGT